MLRQLVNFEIAYAKVYSKCFAEDHLIRFWDDENTDMILKAKNRAVKRMK